MAAAGRWRRVLVEEREIGAAGAGGTKIAFRPDARADPGSAVRAWTSAARGFVRSAMTAR